MVSMTFIFSCLLGKDKFVRNYPFNPKVSGTFNLQPISQFCYLFRLNTFSFDNSFFSDLVRVNRFCSLQSFFNVNEWLHFTHLVYHSNARTSDELWVLHVGTFGWECVNLSRHCPTFSAQSCVHYGATPTIPSQNRKHFLLVYFSYVS